MARKKSEAEGTAPAAENEKKPATRKQSGRKKAEPGKKTSRRPRKEKPAESQAPEKEAKEAAAEENVAKSGKKRGGAGTNGNLIPLNQRTKSEQREIARAGGIASGETRRKRRAMREYLCDFLDQDANQYWRKNMEALGFNADEMSNEAAMILSIFSSAVNKHDINAFRTVMEYAGRAPLQQMRENEAISKMSQALALAERSMEDKGDGETDVVFYIPDNGREIILDDNLVEVET